MMTATQIRKWLDSLKPDTEVGIDAGGFTLRPVDGDEYLEVGGLPQDEPVLLTVTELLIARGIKATYEYPGSIHVIEPSGRYVVYGDINETICGDVYRSLDAYESGDPEPEGISSDIPADCADAERIATFIESQSKGVPQ